MRLNFLVVFFFFSFIFKAGAQSGNEPYYTSVYFPSSYVVGDFVEFVKVSPYDASASGNYEISISYTRGGIAAAATHLASISHSNAPVWREVGRTNNNGYTNPDAYNFTVDCNGQYGNSRFRIRAVNTLGVPYAGLTVNIKVTPINLNGSWTALSAAGSDLTVDKMQTMTDEWNLYVGNTFSTDGAKLAIRANADGNVGIGTKDPKGYKLAVAGKFIAEEVKVQLQGVWPDYVFDKNYKLDSLSYLEAYLKTNKHLPEIPSANDIMKDGLNVGKMNALLLKKIEEITLHLIEKDKKLTELDNRLKNLERIKSN